MYLPDTTGLSWRKGIIQCLESVQPRSRTSLPSSPLAVLQLATVRGQHKPAAVRGSLMPTAIRSLLMPAGGRPCTPGIASDIWGYVLEPSSRALLLASPPPRSPKSSQEHFGRRPYIHGLSGQAERKGHGDPWSTMAPWVSCSTLETSPVSCRAPAPPPPSSPVELLRHDLSHVCFRLVTVCPYLVCFLSLVHCLIIVQSHHLCLINNLVY